MAKVSTNQEVEAAVGCALSVFPDDVTVFLSGLTKIPCTVVIVVSDGFVLKKSQPSDSIPLCQQPQREDVAFLSVKPKGRQRANFG